MAQLGFNAGDYDPTDDFEPLPAGEYLTMITESTLENTKTGGRMVKLAYTVMEGQFEGRKLWSQHNIENRNPKAEEIGRKELSRIAHAISQPMISDTDQLLQQIVRIRIVIKNDPGYGPKNEVKKWIGTGNNHPSYQQQAAVPQQQAPQQGTNRPPYQAPGGQQQVPSQQQPPAGHPAAQHNTPPWGAK